MYERFKENKFYILEHNSRLFIIPPKLSKIIHIIKLQLNN